jgi:hypothetical protein
VAAARWEYAHFWMSSSRPLPYWPLSVFGGLRLLLRNVFLHATGIDDFCQGSWWRAPMKHNFLGAFCAFTFFYVAVKEIFISTTTLPILMKFFLCG